MKTILTKQELQTMLSIEYKNLKLAKQKLNIKNIRQTKRETFKKDEEIIFVTNGTKWGLSINPKLDYDRKRELSKLVSAYEIIEINVSNMKSLINGNLYDDMVNLTNDWINEAFYIEVKGLSEEIEKVRAERRERNKAKPLSNFEIITKKEHNGKVRLDLNAWNMKAYLSDKTRVAYANILINAKLKESQKLLAEEMEEERAKFGRIILDNVTKEANKQW